MSFEEYIRRNILDPLGMTESSFLYPDIARALGTTSHIDEPARISEVYPYNRRHAPSSTLNSIVQQMTRWMLANLQRGELNGVQILKTESYEHLCSPPVGVGRGGDSVGLSGFTSQHQGHRTYTTEVPTRASVVS